jgi:hypothetical protein
VLQRCSREGLLEREMFQQQSPKHRYLKPNLSKAARLIESITAKTVRVEAHHQRNERLKNRPSIAAISAPMKQKNRMNHRLVVIESRIENIQTAPTPNISPFYRPHCDVLIGACAENYGWGILSVTWILRQLCLNAGSRNYDCHRWTLHRALSGQFPFMVGDNCC